MSSPAVEPASGATTQRELFEIADRVLPGSGLGSYSLAEDIRLIYSHGKGSRTVGRRRQRVYRLCRWRRRADSRAYASRRGRRREGTTRSGAHMFGSLNDVAVHLAERLVNDIPCAEKIAYATTGSEATAYAMRLARAFTGRSKILKFEGAYHGNHDYAIVSTFPKETGSYPQGSPDSAGQPDATVSTMLVCPYNDLATLRKIVAEHHADIAAIFAEAVQRIIPAEPEFLHGIRKLCDEYDILFILDEVVTGFRLGYGGAQAVVRRQARPVDPRQGGRRRRALVLYRRTRRRHRPVRSETERPTRLYLFQRHLARQPGGRGGDHGDA